MADIIDGEALAAALRRRVALGVEQFQAKTGAAPALAVILVGEDPASQVYVRRKVRQTAEVGMVSREHRLPADLPEAALLALIGSLNEDPGVHGVLVQLPLPPHIDAAKVLDAIHPGKDVDGFHPVNVGRLSSGTGGLTPCTPLGCMMLLETVVADFRGLKAVVIGKSNIVGKPVALLLLERECTVTVTHILTRNLPEIVRTADILVVAAGTPGLVRGDWVKPGAVVVDVGINRIALADGSTRLVGDVAAGETAHAAAVTPVPGGVGPMTIACLLANTLKAAHALAGLPAPPPSFGRPSSALSSRAPKSFLATSIQEQPQRPGLAFWL
jgi:methylenetetrahydrofolate dehydrogenase (NADP+)/methenyltetrahydrofolate cyclohydrolase